MGCEYNSLELAKERYVKFWANSGGMLQAR